MFRQRGGPVFTCKFIRKEDKPMATKCDFYMEKDGRKDFCTIKGEPVSYEHYKYYCKYNDHSCPIYQYFLKNKR